MEDQLREKLQANYRINKILWMAILADVFILAVIVFVFDHLNILTEPLISNINAFNNISLIVVIVLLFTIMLMKRSFLLPSGLVEKAKKNNLIVNEADISDMQAELAETGKLLFKVQSLLRRYFLIIWSIANFVVLLGFLTYILTLNRWNFVVYAIVGLYSLSINYPRFGIIEDCYYYFKNN